MKFQDVKIMYWGMVIFTCILIIYSYVPSAKDKDLFHSHNYKNLNTGWERMNVDGTKEKIKLVYRMPGKGDYIKIQRKINLLGENDEVIAIRPCNQTIKVYVEKEKIYDSSNIIKKGLTKSMGIVWVFVPMKPEYNEKIITIEFKNDYNHTRVMIGSIYLGDKYDIISNLFHKNIFGIVISYVLFANALFLFVCSILAKYKLHTNGLAYISLFGLLFSVWSGIETGVMQFFLSYIQVFSLVSYEILALAPMLLVMFAITKKQIDKREGSLIIGLLVLNALVTNILQLRKIADLEESSIGIKIIILVVLVYVIGKNLIKIWKMILNKEKGWITELSFIVLMSTFILDMVMFFLYGKLADSAYFTRVGFLIYILILSVGTVSNIYHVIYDGKRKVAWKELAYVDVLTGIKSRIAYEEALEEDMKEPEKFGVIIIDINNLKKINDSYGHQVGDQYLIHSASEFKKLFGSKGDVYRIGGDEFAILLNTTEEKCIQGILMDLDQLLGKIILSHMKLEISFAYGVGIFQKDEDADIFGTIHRADKNMYEHKSRIKGSGFILEDNG